MTPLQLAKEHCANYQSDGSCLGIGIHNDGSLFRFKPEGQPCVLSPPLKRCAYFENVVLMRSPADEPCPAPARVLNDQFAEGLRLYAAATNEHLPVTQKGQRLCRLCRQRTVEPPKQLCYVCAEERKAKSQEQATAKYRSKKV